MSKGTEASLDHLTDTELRSLLDLDALPKHIAVIMDGNGRWAELRGLPRIAGHQEGINSVREMMTFCGELGIGTLTIYAFSQENWKRPIPEINALMMLLEHYLQSEMDALIEKGVRFRAIGRVNTLPPSALQWVRRAERETLHLDKLTLTVALSYGGRSEIVDAVRRLAEDCTKGLVQTEAIDETLLEGYLSTQGLPDPDLAFQAGADILLICKDRERQVAAMEQRGEYEDAVQANERTRASYRCRPRHERCVLPLPDRRCQVL